MILQAYRPDGADASDPFFAEALEQARLDPELQKWLMDEKAFEMKIQARLQSAVPVPADLKSNLLALRKIVRPIPWWRQPVTLAAAAVVLAVALIAAWGIPHEPAQLASFRQAMVRYSMQEHGHIVFESHDLAKIQQWLQDRDLDTNFDLPAALQNGAAQGCRVVNWNGHQATMICFFLHNGEHMDLFVMNRADLPGLGETNTPRFASAGGLMTAVWTRGDKVYLLAGEHREFLQKLLQST